MHDVGKIGIRDNVLLKPDKLDDEEWINMKTHVDIGVSILSGGDSKTIQLAQEIAATHHEKYEETGYPNGLKGKDIFHCRTHRPHLRRVRRSNVRTSLQESVDSGRRHRITKTRKKQTLRSGPGRQIRLDFTGNSGNPSPLLRNLGRGRGVTTKATCGFVVTQTKMD